MLRAVAKELASFGAMQAVDGPVGAALTARCRFVHVDAVFEQVIDAREIATHADGPGDRRGADLEHALDFVEQFDGWPAFAVELVDEGHDRRVAHATDFHELDRSLFDAFSAV